MNFPKKYLKFFKYATLVTLTSSAGWICYQVKKTKDILNNAIDASIFNMHDSFDHKANQNSDFITLEFNERWSIKSLWTSMLFAYAKRLIVLANNENKYIRKHAIRQLANIQALDYWHFIILSRRIDSKIAVGLARTLTADQRIFPEPPTPCTDLSHEKLTNYMNEFLVKLYTKNPHSCLGYFISTFFVEHQDVGKFAETDSHSLALSIYIQSSHDVLPLCLETLLHHASQDHNALEIVHLNGLPLLMELYHRYKDNNEIVATICRIISYISIHKHLGEDLFKSGWISILAKLLKNDDVRVNIPVAKALANLDADEDSLYLQRLYLLYPQMRTDSVTKVDVVFVHGLLGGVFFTWRQRDRDTDTLSLAGKKSHREAHEVAQPIQQKKSLIDTTLPDFAGDIDELSHRNPLKYQVVLEDLPTNTNIGAEGPYSYPAFRFVKHKEEPYTFCWPKDWLGKDCDNLRVIGVNYETNLSMWAPVCPKEMEKTLEIRSEEVLSQLIKVGLGQRPIVWVTHSMGGLMVKNVLYKASKSPDPAVRKLCSNSKGVVFYSTPHIGSSLAKFSQASALVVWPTVEVQELELDSPKLHEIHKNFLNVVKEYPMKIVSFVETQPTIVSALKFKILIVEPQSGNPNIGDYYEVPLDHLGICKPASRRSFLYQKVLHLIESVISEHYVERTTNYTD